MVEEIIAKETGRLPEGCHARALVRVVAPRARASAGAPGNDHPARRDGGARHRHLDELAGAGSGALRLHGFLVTKENRVLTALTGMLLIVGATLAIAASLLLFKWTLDFPALRVITMAAALCIGMWLSRVFVIGPLGFMIGFVMSVAQSFVDGAPGPEFAVRALLWLWVVLVYPIALTVMINQVLLPAHPRAGPKPAARAKDKKHLFVADAFTNPAHARFALKVTLAAMACYFLYTGVDWSGIHTAFITCCFIALESTGATLRKGWLRLCGCLIGGALGFISILYVVPRMETIASLVLLTATVSALAGWVAAGSPRIAYAGLQIAFAFFLAIFQGFAPATDLDVIRDPRRGNRVRHCRRIRGLSLPLAGARSSVSSHCKMMDVRTMERILAASFRSCTSDHGPSPSSAQAMIASRQSGR